MTDTSKRFKLCYVRGNIMYFTDNFERQWGDDWDDAPYEYNAEEPYDRQYYTEYDDEWCKKHGCGNIRYIAFTELDADQPCDHSFNSPYSVKDINKGYVPWLSNRVFGSLMAGATMEESIEWLKKTGCKWGELHE